jgi:hypothetical protein
MWLPNVWNLVSLLIAELDGEEFDRSAAQQLALKLTEECPAISGSLELIAMRMSQSASPQGE